MPPTNATDIVRPHVDVLAAVAQTAGRGELSRLVLADLDAATHAFTALRAAVMAEDVDAAARLAERAYCLLASAARTAARDARAEARRVRRRG